MIVVFGLVRIMFYILLGPLLLALAGNVAIAIAISTGWALADPGTSPLDVFSGFFSSENLRQAYVIGFVPMLLTGIIAFVLSVPFSGMKHWLAVAFGGASVSVALAWIVFISSPISEGADILLLGLVSAFAGGVAGFLCAVIFDLIPGLRRRPA